MKMITQEEAEDLKQVKEAREDYKAGRFKKLKDLMAENKVEKAKDF